jgi:hypothetical protein
MAYFDIYETGLLFENRNQCETNICHVTSRQRLTKLILHLKNATWFGLWCLTPKIDF